MRFQLDAPILAHRQLAEFEFELTLHAPQIAEGAQPGQFLQVLYDQTYNPFTRRPFSIYKVDREKGSFDIVYLARGVFTQGLRNKQVGQTLSVVGPLGNQFEADSAPGVTHVLVGGGVGAPPIYFFAERLLERFGKEAKVVVINGAQTRELLVGIEEFEVLGIEALFTTDDGSVGTRGRVTDVLVPLLQRLEGPVHVYTCGPTAMLKAVAEVSLRAGAACHVSVETPMPCGLGVCMGCVVKVKNQSPEGFSYQRSCYEGPVFSADEILWE